MNYDKKVEKMKVKIGTEGLLTSILNSITHFMLPWLSGSLITYSLIADDPNNPILLVIGAFILFPICLFDITFKDEEKEEVESV